MKGSPVQVRASALGACDETELLGLRRSNRPFRRQRERNAPVGERCGRYHLVGAGMQAGTIDPEQANLIQAAVDAAVRSADSGTEQF